MQHIASRLISNTPELAKMLDADSALRGKKPPSPNTKKKPVKNEAETHEKYKELAGELQASQDRLVEAQEELRITKERFVEREIQYRRIIEELQNEVRGKGGDADRLAQIKDLHKEILDNIGVMQNRTSKILVEQEADIRRFFHKKINEIKDRFREDHQNKSEKQEEHAEKERHMLGELEWVKNIAHKIDDENRHLTKSLTALKADHDLQLKEKEMLLQQLLAQRKLNATLSLQLDHFQSLASQMGRPTDSGASPGQPLKVEHDRKEAKVTEGRDECGASSRLTKGDTDTRFEATVSHLQRMIDKERSKVRKVKALYLKELGRRNDVEATLKQLLEEVRESAVALEKNKKKHAEQLGEKGRRELLERILSHEKLLTLVYDKAFSSGAAGLDRQTPDMSPELAAALEDYEDDTR